MLFDLSNYLSVHWDCFLNKSILFALCLTSYMQLCAPMYKKKRLCCSWLWSSDPIYIVGVRTRIDDFNTQRRVTGTDEWNEKGQLPAGGIVFVFSKGCFRGVKRKPAMAAVSTLVFCKAGNGFSQSWMLIIADKQRQGTPIIAADSPLNSVSLT